ncbi:glucose/arabinose dehydrogenase [Archangium gephyra]|uniref:Glucose/arabinose dehydrogenase n=1 Tax=Archangium gephyra TaxID=48 RepID=A0AAC8QFI0_9BACT|nr:L-sorbosone dehydrogenase [Archangium gephyra]REG27065.1 glucose/arabinose dehydrogenase [Archangium gephyra]
MNRMHVWRVAGLLGSVLWGCSHAEKGPPDRVETRTETVELPRPYTTDSVRKFSKVRGWPEGKAPVAEGFTVKRYAADLVSPRNLYVTPQGDVLVAEANTELRGMMKFGAKLVGYAASARTGPSANRITLLRDADHDGVPETRTVFLEGLNQPFGMLVHGDFFYVANTDALWRYPYSPGATSITGKGEKLLDLPAGGYNNHWTRNLLAHPDGTKLYVTVGSGSNVGEHGLDNEVRRANVLELNPDGSGERIFASGLRNPVGLGFAPGSRVLWTTVNERDELGDELVPDYLTHVEDGAFYGWPYSYFGAHVDPRVKEQKPELVKQAKVPDVPLGSHTASLGLAFNEGPMFPERFRHGAFIGQHGSWNRSKLSGYQVVFVPFSPEGQPTAPAEPFLTGFIHNADEREVYGRPVGVAFLPDGSLLVADDAGNIVWRVSR